MSADTPPEGPDCDPDSLRALGWRQGCFLELELPLHAIRVDDQGKPTVDKDVHPLWVIAEQDCGLAWGVAAEQHEPTIEIRPVLTESPPQDQGVRSAKFSLGDGRYLDAASPRQMVCPALLAAARDQERHVGCLLVDVARGLKTWLGLRYDRPAVPQVFIPTYTQLSSRVRKRRHSLRDRVRDVLVSFAQSDDGGCLFDLVAVLPSDWDLSEQERAELEDWLAEVCLNFPTDLGIAISIQAATTSEVSVDFLERSYTLDVSYVTWPAKGGGPVGAA
jgi:hypothetical protein